MSNLNFKATFEMERSELVEYIHELQARVQNADTGARLFKDEAQHAKVELLKWKEMAGQADDRFIEMSLFFERHIEALCAVADSSDASALEESDYVSFVRLLRYMLGVVLKNHRRMFMEGVRHIETPEDFSDIPF